MDAIIKAIRTHGSSFFVSGLLIYFTVAFAIGGAHTLLLSYQGTPDYTAVVLARVSGYAFDPTLDKLVLTTALIGAVKLAVAGFFLFAVSESSRSEGEIARPEHGALDLALYSASAVTLILGGAAWIAGDASGVVVHAAHAVLIGIAVAAGLRERKGAQGVTSRARYLAVRAAHERWTLPLGRAPH